MLGIAAAIRFNQVPFGSLFANLKNPIQIKINSGIYIAPVMRDSFMRESCGKQFQYKPIQALTTPNKAAIIIYIEGRLNILLLCIKVANTINNEQ